MRENMGKYRGKRLDTENYGEWAYGYLVIHPGSAFILETGYPIPNGDFYAAPKKWAYVDPATVGECSDVTTKHGKMVYEGDILFDGKTQYVVERGATTCGLQAVGRDSTREIWSLYHLCTGHNNHREIEVVGTIFDKEAQNG